MKEKMISNIISTIDFGQRLGLCDIIVYPYESEHHPHFHIESKNINFEAAIGIYDSEYYDHEGAVGRLLLEECILLNNIYQIPLNNSLSLGLVARILWVAKNDDKNCPDFADFPDYTKLI